MRHAKCDMRHAACNMRRAVEPAAVPAVVQHSTCDMRYAICDMRHATSKMQHATSDKQRAGRCSTIRAAQPRVHRKFAEHVANFVQCKLRTSVPLVHAAVPTNYKGIRRPMSTGGNDRPEHSHHTTQAYNRTMEQKYMQATFQAEVHVSALELRARAWANGADPHYCRACQ